MIIYRKQKEYSTKLGRTLVGINKKVLRKSDMAAKRAAVATEGKLNNTKKLIQEAAINPGSVVNKGVEETVRHPISATSQIAGKATMVVDPTGVGLAPIGAIGTAGEVALRKYSPKYARTTNKLADKYHNSKLSKHVEGAVNGIINFGKAVTM